MRSASVTRCSGVTSVDVPGSASVGSNGELVFALCTGVRSIENAVAAPTASSTVVAIIFQRRRRTRI